MGRRLPDHVGLQPAGDPDAGRALDDRGPLPRPEGRRGLAGLRRQRQVRRRVAARAARHRRRPGAWRWGTWCCRSSSSTGRCRTSPTTSSATPTCRSWSRSTRAADAYVPGKFLTAADLRRRRRGRGVQDRVAGRGTGEPVVPNGSLGFRFGESGAGRWNLDLGDVDPLLTCRPRRRGGGDRRAAALRHRSAGAGHARGAACRSGGSAASWSRRSSTCCWPSTASAATGLPGDWPTGYDDADEPVHPGLAGADHRRAGRARRRGSAGSSPPTPRSPAAAR